MLKTVSDSLLSIVYPQECHVCGNSVENSRFGVACSDCWSQTKLFSGGESICFKCGKLQSLKTAEEETFCRECDDHYYDSARAAGVYEGALAGSILHLKREPYISSHLRGIVEESFFRSSFLNADRIIPVPLSKRRLFERGYNQAGLLAKILSDKTGIVLDQASFIRTKHAAVHRAGMDRRGRELSVERSFDVSRKAFIKDKTILLIDDVLTSGATASICAKTLKRYGARKVFVFTAARTT
ncbi:MAG: ComF family protein [Pyrinomonadaceae bacterium]